jgi:class 3 adenylate cyclase
MKYLRLFDDSPLLAARFRHAGEAMGWKVLDPGSEIGTLSDALAVDPAWKDYEGLRLLHCLRRSCGNESNPVIALVRENNPPVQALLSLYGLPFIIKGNLNPENVFSRLELARAQESSAQSREAFQQAIQDWNTGVPPKEASFDERVITHGLLKLFSEISTKREAQDRVLAFLVAHFPISEEEVLRSWAGDWGDLFVDPRVNRLYRTARDFVLPVFRILEDLERGTREVERIHGVFSRFLPAEVIGDLLRRKSDTALLRGEKRQVVAFFSHIRDFDFYVENNDPPVLVDFMNRHFQLYSDIIRRHGGFINKYIGDAVFALFGAPVSYLDNAQRALAAAQEILAALPGTRHPGLAFPPGGYRVGIGLNEGPAIVGNIGSTDSFDYTAIGDAINLAARLESLNKYYETRILFPRSFSANLRPSEIQGVLRTVDRVKVKGKKTATTMFTAVPAPESEREKEFLDAYEKGLKMVRIGNWLTAREWFERALERRPDDVLTRLHRERALRYEKEPPSDWDGAEELSFK